MHIARSGIGRTTLLQERISATTECGTRVPDDGPAPDWWSPGAVCRGALLCQSLRLCLRDIRKTSRRRIGGSAFAQ